MGRTSATVLSAYNLPSVEGYLRDFEERLAVRGFERRPQIMLANGGCASVDRAVAHPVALIGSGPAAGPSAAAFHSSESGRRDIIVMDMGGTSFDVCLIHDGRPSMSRHLYVDHQPVGVQGSRCTRSAPAGAASAGSTPAVPCASVPRAPVPTPDRPATTSEGPNLPSPTPTWFSAVSHPMRFWEAGELSATRRRNRRSMTTSWDIWESMSSRQLPVSSKWSTPTWFKRLASSR